MAYQVIPEKTTDIYDTLVVKIKDENQLDEVIAKIQNKLMTARHVTQKNMTFRSLQERKCSRQSRYDEFYEYLSSRNSSGFIDSRFYRIANTMFTSVLEWQKKLEYEGYWRAQSDILLIFLFNAAFIDLSEE